MRQKHLACATAALLDRLGTLVNTTAAEQSTVRAGAHAAA